jgi:4-amino-4-deoxy-L-arabinose transferase-like glycosyltransferase
MRPDPISSGCVSWRVLLAPLAALALGCGAFVITLSFAVRGALPAAVGSLLAPVALIGVVVAAWTVLCRAGLTDAEPALLRRHGFWLIVLLAALELPALGAFGLIDPWESHYAEVAREMLARRDFISTWWAQEGWFMSKPVLSFWLEALSMSALGVEAAPGRVLEGSAGSLARPEWAVRLPGALFALVGCSLLYRGVAASLGRARGLAAAVVLATAAQWTIAARHALTDTPFVAALTGCFGFSLLAWSTPEDAVLSSRQIELGRARLTVHAGWLLIGCVSCAVGAMLWLLLSLNLDVDLSGPSPRLALMGDALRAGSPGNCGLPSQPACADVPLAHPGLSPALSVLVWGAILLGLVRSLARERRVRRHLLLAAWFCMALATVGKGAAGFVLPLAIAGLSLVREGRWRELTRSELARGAVLIVLLVAPWYVEMFARHGRVIFDELVLKHMLGRALAHLHDTNAGEDVGLRYYVWQLGYAMFPWTGFVPGALSSACVRRADRSRALVRVLDFSLLWLVVTFALFSVMHTKFHHYILPAVPALAVLVGVYVAECWQAERCTRHRAAVAVALGLGGALLLVRIGVDLILPIGDAIPGAARFFHLVSYQYRRPWPAEFDVRGLLLACTVVCSVISLGQASARWARHLLALQFGVSLAFAVWLGQCYLPRLGPSFGQRQVMEAFYRDRTSVSEPLIAYRLNWKGENFYTGNHLAIFVSGGKRLKRYLRERAMTDPVVHVVLETRRLGGLRAELGPVDSFDIVTDRRHSDKICLVRVRLRQPPPAASGSR